jgi:GNAT superfamily N-acetyltransferase
VALALDYTKYVERVEVFPYMAPISAVAELLKVQFAPHNQAINIFIGCTHPKHRRQGLFLRLIQEVEKEGKKKGYTEFNG